MENKLKNMEYLRLLQKLFRTELTKRIPVIKRKENNNGYQVAQKVKFSHGTRKLHKNSKKYNQKEIINTPIMFGLAQKERRLIKSKYVAVALAPVSPKKKILKKW